MCAANSAGRRCRSANSTSDTSWTRGVSIPEARRSPYNVNSTASCDSRTTSAQLSVSSKTSNGAQTRLRAANMVSPERSSLCPVGLPVDYSPHETPANYVPSDPH